MNIWQSRNLSLKGKVLIIKTLILPQIYHLISSLFCPSDMLKKIDKLILAFIWGNKPAKIKKNTLIGNYGSGGLKMPDIYTIHTTAKIKWINRLKETNGGNWQLMFQYLLNIDKAMLKKKLPLDSVNECLTSFHKQVFECWVLFHGRESRNVEEIYSEFIFDNKYICTEKKPLKLQNFKIQKDYGDDMVISDIITDGGGFLSLQQFNTKFKTNLDHLNYNKIKSAIPFKWKEKLRIAKVNNTANKVITVSYKGKLRDLTKVSNKALYWIALQQKCQNITAIEKWIETYPFLEAASWHKIFKLAHIITNEPYLHSFQYKILNRILNCNHNLFKWKVKESPVCIYCKKIDTIEHHLFFCVYSNLFWTRLQNWFHKAYKTPHISEITVCEVLFGTEIDANPKTAHDYCKNFIVLMGKWYINHTRSNNKDLIFEEYLNILKAKLRLYTTIFRCPKTYEGVDSEIQNKFLIILQYLQKG